MLARFSGRHAIGLRRVNPLSFDLLTNPARLENHKAKLA